MKITLWNKKIVNLFRCCGGMAWSFSRRQRMDFAMFTTDRFDSCSWRASILAVPPEGLMNRSHEILNPVTNQKFDAPPLRFPQELIFLLVDGSAGRIAQITIVRQVSQHRHHE